MKKFFAASTLALLIGSCFFVTACGSQKPCPCNEELLPGRVQALETLTADHAELLKELSTLKQGLEDVKNQQLVSMADTLKAYEQRIKELELLLGIEEEEEGNTPKDYITVTLYYGCQKYNETQWRWNPMLQRQSKLLIPLNGPTGAPDGKKWAPVAKSVEDSMLQDVLRLTPGPLLEFPLTPTEHFTALVWMEVG